MDEEYQAFLRHRNDCLAYALQYLDGMKVTEEEIFLQAERFFDFVLGASPKVKKSRSTKIIKLVKKEK